MWGNKSKCKQIWGDMSKHEQWRQIWANNGKISKYRQYKTDNISQYEQTLVIWVNMSNPYQTLGDMSECE